MDWDGNQVSHANLDLAGNGPAEEDDLSPSKAKNRFREFIRNFRSGNLYPYRDQLLHRFRKQENYLEVNLGDLNRYDSVLQNELQQKPNEYLPILEAAAKEVLTQLTMEGDNADDIPDTHVILTSEQQSMPLRQLNARLINNLIKVSGIVISASRVRAKANAVSIQCGTCNTVETLPCTSAFGGVALPRICKSAGEHDQRCPLDPFRIVPDKGTYVDQQTLKLQESPEVVPTGEMPRNILLSVDRKLVDKVAPGTRVSVLAISSIFNSGAKKQIGAVAIRTPYLKVVGIQVDVEGAGRASANFTRQDEAMFHDMSRTPNIFEKLANSVAPSISGDYTVDIKKAIACQLLGGSRKLLPDGTRLRGDINILLLGDPSTAKSQFLKFVEKVAPVGVYTSGKGSSAAGLTASVVKDSKGEFFLEGGAMVLADGGVVCIDEFDKMRESDRVAIHEAMEQQTISIAKAGITTILNSRSSVLAAANPLYGRYDDMKSAAENIDLMTTILSRFDLIFVVRDVRDEEKDRAIAKHVLGVHINCATGTDETEGEYSIGDMKKFIQYCRMHRAPRLSAEAASVLRNQYVTIREEMRRASDIADEEQAVPITVRQLEALVRISESLAKMKLAHEATVDDVKEALRLFKVSTMNAAHSGSGAGAEGFLKPDIRNQVDSVEAQMRKRIMIGSDANTRQLQEQFVAMVSLSLISWF
jgi:DNA replication licensing factor MCM5